MDAPTSNSSLSDREAVNPDPRVSANDRRPISVNNYAQGHHLNPPLAMMPMQMPIHATTTTTTSDSGLSDINNSLMNQHRAHQMLREQVSMGLQSASFPQMLMGNVDYQRFRADLFGAVNQSNDSYLRNRLEPQRMGDGFTFLDTMSLPRHFTGLGPGTHLPASSHGLGFVNGLHSQIRSQDPFFNAATLSQGLSPYTRYQHPQLAEAANNILSDHSETLMSRRRELLLEPVTSRGTGVHSATTTSQNTMMNGPRIRAESDPLGTQTMSTTRPTPAMGEREDQPASPSPSSSGSGSGETSRAASQTTSTSSVYPTRRRSVSEGAPNSIVASARSSDVDQLLAGQSSIVLSMECDGDCLSDYQCFLRAQIELFEATNEDVQWNAQRMNKGIVLGQVGIRCRYCASLPPWSRARGAVYYSATLDGLYQAGQNMSKNHLCLHCKVIPQDVKQMLMGLKDVKRRASGGKQYWADGARVLGVFEDRYGLRFKKRVPICKKK